MYKCIFRDLDPEVFHSEVQICSYPNMGMVQEGQAIRKEQWTKWNAESIAQIDAQEYQGIEINVASINSDNTVLYDTDSDMIIDYDIVQCESVNSDMNVLDELPDINQLRTELTVLGGSDSPHLTLLCQLTIHQPPLDIHQSPLLTVHA